MNSEVANFVVDFLRTCNETEPKILFCEYAEYLLNKSNCYRVPVNIRMLREYFNIKLRYDNTISQRGMVFRNTFIINENDSPTVKRFTQAHEFMEMLVVELFAEEQWRLTESKSTFELKKERWCEIGAAELLMPADLFFPRVSHDFILDQACRLANTFDTSLLATLLRMLECENTNCIVLELKQWNKRQTHRLSDEQTGRLNQHSEVDCLEVSRSWRSINVIELVRPRERIEHNTSFLRTMKDGNAGKISDSRDSFVFPRLSGTFNTESILVRVQGQPVVYGVIKIPRPLI